MTNCSVPTIINIYIYYVPQNPYLDQNSCCQYMNTSYLSNYNNPQQPNYQQSPYFLYSNQIYFQNPIISNNNLNHSKKDNKKKNPKIITNHNIN